MDNTTKAKAPTPDQLGDEEDLPLLEESLLAGQIDRTLLPRIYFPPWMKMTATGHLQNKSNQEYHDLFETISYYQSTNNRNVRSRSPVALKRFNSLSLAEQLAGFMRSQQLTTDQLRIRWQLTVDLLHILRQHFKTCDAFAYGSLLTDLGSPTSDIDISIDMDGDGYKYFELKPKPVRQAIVKEAREKSAQILSTAPNPHFFPKLFASKVQIIGTTHPIIRLKQAQTGISMDISFGNRLAIQNSRLLSFYMDYEPRLRQLIVFLRYWGKFHWISGSVHIKQYALALLALVYFMEKQLVPSVLLLQATAAIQQSEQGVSTNPDIIGEWDSSFCRDKKKIDKYFKTATISHGAAAGGNDPKDETKLFLDLLTDFFGTVAERKYHSSVICPLLGAGLPRHKFWKTAEEFIEELPVATPDDFFSWRKTQFRSLRNVSFGGALVIQDPFVLDFNVGGVCKKWNLDTFVAAARATVTVLKSGPLSLLDLFVCPSTYYSRPHSRSLKSDGKKTEERPQQQPTKINATGTTAEITSVNSELTLNQNGAGKKPVMNGNEGDEGRKEPLAYEKKILTGFINLKNGPSSSLGLPVSGSSHPLPSQSDNKKTEKNSDQLTGSSTSITAVRSDGLSKLTLEDIGNGAGTSKTEPDDKKKTTPNGYYDGATLNATGNVTGQMIQTPFRADDRNVRIASEILSITRGKEAAMKNTMGNPRHVTSFSLHYSPFVDMYLTELYRCYVLGGANDPSEYQVKCQIVKLWGDFAMDFIKTFFSVGLGMMEENVTIAFSTPMEKGEGWMDQLKYGKYFKRRMEGVMKCPTELEMCALRKNCRDLGLPSSTIYYEVRTFKVTYPFWERSTTGYKDNTSPVEQEGEMSAMGLKNFNNAKSVWKGAPKFSPFLLDILVKLNARRDGNSDMCGFPSVSFIVQDSFIDGDSGGKGPRRAQRDQVLSSVVKALRKAFPAHQKYHLSKWLKNAKL